MSALRIRIGEVWWTGEPGIPAAVATAAKGPAFAQIPQMQMRGGPDWQAQQPWDLRQRAVQVSYSVTCDFGAAPEMAEWLALVLSMEPEHAWQEDAVLRWEHEDGIGYDESIIPWAALRISSISHDGPTTLHMQINLLGPSLEDHALYSRMGIITEDGKQIVTEDGRAIYTDEHFLFHASS